MHKKGKERPPPVQPGIIDYLLDVAEMDGRHYADKKAENMCAVLGEIIEHSHSDDPEELLRQLVRKIELTLL